MDRLLDELVALERAALDRWITLDPQGYLDIMAPEVTYFDPKIIHSHWSFVQPELKQT